MTSQQYPPTPWFARPDPKVARRALWIALAWSYVAAVAAVLVVGLAALVAALVALVIYLLDFSTRQFDIGAAWGPSVIVAWVAFPLAAIVAIWTAAYGSTQERSVGRSTTGIVAAAGVGLGMWAFGSLALTATVLAVGWAVVLPAEHPARIVARLLLAGVAVFIVPGWERQGLEWVVVFSGLGPLLAAASVLVGELAWLAVLRLRSRSDGGVMRAPSSLDV